MVKLPEKFSSRMQEMLGDEYELYLESLEKPAKSGIRLNTLKTSSEDFFSISEFKLSKIPWISNGYFYSEDEQPSKSPLYYAGLYYIQEPSAMTPAEVFDVKPGYKVLDICAAPGGKSTALGTKLCGEGLLVSNDVSNSRAKALLKNIELFGIKNAVVMSETSDRLAERFPEYFDRILVDAPCSGEGMFRKQSSIMANWEQYGCEYYSKLQHMILADAVKMLAPGGKLLYSTCTFSPLEDEQAVAWLLENHPELSLCDPADENTMVKFKECGFESGRKEWLGDYACSGIEKTIRLFPHKLDGEGHFIAVFEKNADSVSSGMVFYAGKSAKKLPDELVEFLGHTDLKYDPDRINIKEGRCFLVPAGLPDLKGLRIMREGLLLGELKKDRFEPSQALAMSLKKEEYDNVYDLASDNPDVIRYLKCESIEIPDSVKDGYVLVCANGHPLGFGKVKKHNFKNKYLPGWRMM